MALHSDYQKHLKERKQTKAKPKPFKNFRYLDRDYLILQRKKYNRQVQTSTETASERKLYETYVRLVKESFKGENTQKKFRLAHVDQLGIDYDILFLYGKKDSGKTWQAAFYIKNLLEKYPDAQIAFIRNSLEEAKGFIEMMNNSDV